ANWSAAQAQSLPLVQQWNRAVFTLPLDAVGRRVLLVPTLRGKAYRIDGVRWQRGGLFEALHSTELVPAAEPDGSAGGPAQARGAILITPPGAAFAVASLGIAAAIPLLGLLLLAALLRGSISITQLASAMTAAVALCCAYIVLRLGALLPAYDDW